MRRAGSKPQSKSFDNKPDAQVWAREIEAMLDKGLEKPDLTADFSQLLKAYNEEMASAVDTTKSSTLRTIDRMWGDTRLSNMKPRTFIDYVAERERQGAGPATILLDLTYIGTVLRHAGVLSAIDTTHALVALSSARAVLRHAGRIAGSVERDRRPTENELKQLRAHWAHRRRDAIPIWRLVLFAICTSMRQSEITSIRWETYDPATRTILIPNRKHPTKKKMNSQRVPLLAGPFTFEGKVVNPVDLMHEQPGRSGRVFPYVSGTVSDNFTRAVDDLKIDDLTFHDLRHDAISRMFEYGMDIVSVAVCSGHRDWKQLKRYTNIRPETLHKD